jgi:hypothetical protein
MRVKFPQAIVFKDYLEMYKAPSTMYYRVVAENSGVKFKPVTEKILEESPETLLYFKDTTADGELIYRAETKELYEKRIKIIEIMTEHWDILRKVEEAMVSYCQLEKITYPTLYFANLSDSRGSDSTYLSAKSIIPMMDGKNKEIRIYIGTGKEYTEGYKTNPKIKMIAEQKMKETLQEKYLNGEFINK